MIFPHDSFDDRCAKGSIYWMRNDKLILKGSIVSISEFQIDHKQFQFQYTVDSDLDRFIVLRRL
jgi:hypothetical protein